jgi:lysyl-tRNA synthetase class 2
MPSTVVRHFACHPATRSLDVEFVSGRRYRYAGVPETIAERFRAAFSKGRFFTARIRDEYPCEERSKTTPTRGRWSPDTLDRVGPTTISEPGNRGETPDAHAG